MATNEKEVSSAITQVKAEQNEYLREVLQVDLRPKDDKPPIPEPTRKKMEARLQSAHEYEKNKTRPFGAWGLVEVKGSGVEKKQAELSSDGQMAVLPGKTGVVMTNEKLTAINETLKTNGSGFRFEATGTATELTGKDYRSIKPVLTLKADGPDEGLAKLRAEGKNVTYADCHRNAVVSVGFDFDPKSGRDCEKAVVPTGIFPQDKLPEAKKTKVTKDTYNELTERHVTLPKELALIEKYTGSVGERNGRALVGGGLGHVLKDKKYEALNKALTETIDQKTEDGCKKLINDFKATVLSDRVGKLEKAKIREKQVAIIVQMKGGIEAKDVTDDMIAETMKSLKGFPSALGKDEEKECDRQAQDQTTQAKTDRLTQRQKEFVAAQRSIGVDTVTAVMIEQSKSLSGFPKRLDLKDLAELKEQYNYETLSKAKREEKLKAKRVQFVAQANGIEAKDVTPEMIAQKEQDASKLAIKLTPQEQTECRRKAEEETKEAREGLDAELPTLIETKKTWNKYALLSLCAETPRGQEANRDKTAIDTLKAMGVRSPEEFWAQFPKDNAATAFDELCKTLKINQYCEPKPGQVMSMVTPGAADFWKPVENEGTLAEKHHRDLEEAAKVLGKRPEEVTAQDLAECERDNKLSEKDVDMWNFHWAGVVMGDKDEYMTFENFSVEDTSAINDKQVFNSYGAKKSFYDAYKESGFFGNSCIAMCFDKAP